jgi:hypothetical protein
MMFDSDRAGTNEEGVHKAYLLPAACLAGPDPELADVRSWFPSDALTERVVLRVKGPEGVNRVAPVSHGIPLAQGSLGADQLDRLRLDRRRGAACSRAGEVSCQVARRLC